MTSEQRESIVGYFEKVGREWRSGQATEHTYRPFDCRFTCYTGNSRGLYSSPQQKVMSQFLRCENVGLCAVRICSRNDSLPVFVTDKITDKTLLSSKDNANVFPLYLYNDNMGKIEKTPNFDAAIYENICAAVNDAPCLQASANTSRNEIREFLCGEPVARLTGHEFEGVKGVRNICDAVHKLYARVKWQVSHAGIGVVHLSRSGINDSLWHGYGRCKLVAFAAIPEIISAGKIAYHSPDWKGRGYESFVLTAPIAIAGEAYCAFVIVNRMKDGYLRFYLHEVANLDELKKRTRGFRSGSSACAALSSTPGSVNNVSKSAEAVNGVKSAGGMRTGFADRSVLSRTPGSVKSLAFSIFAVNGGENREEGMGTREQAVMPEDVFNYIYGVLHTPSYRERYREFLKIDFPRIPYPKGAAEFRRIAAVGEKLVRVHLMKDEAVTNPFANPYAKFEGAGEGQVEKVVFQSCTSGQETASPFGRVHINGGQWFDNVPETAWNFYIGGYQPAQKWLKDRKGRKLTSEDQQHYRAIVAALMRTDALMKELEPKEREKEQ